MDIKLKNTNRKPLRKSIVLILIVTFMTAIALQWAYIKYADLNIESIIEKEYKNSKTFGDEVNKAINETYNLLEKEVDNRVRHVNYIYLVKGPNNKSFSNVKKYSKGFYSINKDSFFAIEEGEYSLGTTTNASLVNNFPGKDDYTMYLAFPNDYMSKKQDRWDNGREIIVPFVFLMAVCILIVLFLLSYLILITAKKEEGKELHVSAIDDMYTEILILGIVPLTVLFSCLHKTLHHTESMDIGISSKHIITMFIIGIAAVVMTTLFLISLLSLVRKIKAGSFLRGSISYMLFRRMYPYLREIFDRNRFNDANVTNILYKRQKIFIITNVILFFLVIIFSMRPVLMIILVTIEIFLVYWYLKFNNQTFDEINKGFSKSLEERIKSEKMKIELITNVSHDLKTPLTSIISYVDLLSKEELSEGVKDYVNILAKKSDRLKNIVSDLFDLAKSTSGDIILDLQVLDLKRLIEQTLGDMEDSVKKSGQKIKTMFPQNPIYIVSDGTRLYRVFQNIIDNALKYSLKGTRIFIELTDDGENIYVIIKNVADYELNFSSQEILQRFNRGDKSRTTEGSGLGLSIAESFTHICGGNFKVDIDGDMFKVVLTFKVSQAVESQGDLKMV